jgi:hypothetical protein
MTLAAMLERINRASVARLRILLVMIVSAVMLSLVTHGNYAGSGDAVHYMIIARSLAFDRDFDLSNDYKAPSNIIKEPPGGHAQIGRNGVLRPVHGVGLPLIASPFFAIAYRLAEMTSRIPASLRRRAKLDEFIMLRQLVAVFMILVTAALALTFFEASWKISGYKALAFVWTLVWTLSPPILSHGYIFFTEVPSALLILFVYSKRDDVLGDSPFQRGLLIGLAAGLLVLIHVRNIGLVLAFALLILWRVRLEPRRGIGFGLGVGAMAVVKVALNVVFWGTIVNTPIEHLAPNTTQAFLPELALRGLGLLFDARHGLLPSAPVYLLAPAAWVVLVRRSRTTGLELLLLVVTYLLFILTPITNAHGWRGGWSPAARFLVPISPFLGLAVPLLLVSQNSLRIGLVLISLQLALDSLFWARPMLLWSEGPGAAPFLEALVGRSAAALLPMWESFNGPVLLTATIGLILWTAFTGLLCNVASASVDHRFIDLESSS